MRLAVSNIAWTDEEEPAVAALLQKMGVRYIEIAPTKRWKNPTKASKLESVDYKTWWHEYGIEVAAFQSMLFNRPDLRLFESAPNRIKTINYLMEYIGLASQMGAGVMVFGSPKNRQRHDIPYQEAWVIAKEFFAQIGTAAHRQNVSFCIEPNAAQYACDFVTTAQEGIKLVTEIASPGFGLHLDIACMTLAGDDIAKNIHQAGLILRHFHISSPYLEQVDGSTGLRHQEAAVALGDIDYKGLVSIEMRAGENGTNLKRVETAVRYAQEVYGNLLN